VAMNIYNLLTIMHGASYCLIASNLWNLRG